MLTDPWFQVFQFDRRLSTGSQLIDRLVINQRVKGQTTMECFTRLYNVVVLTYAKLQCDCKFMPLLAEMFWWIINRRKITCLSVSCSGIADDGLCMHLEGCPDSKVMGPSWGPSGADRTQMGPMLAPWILLSGCTLIHDNSLDKMTVILKTTCSSAFYWQRHFVFW